MKTPLSWKNHYEQLSGSTTPGEGSAPGRRSRSSGGAPGPCGSRGRMIVALLPLAALLASCVSAPLKDDSGLLAAAQEKGNCEDKIARIVEFHGEFPPEARKLYEAARSKVNGWLGEVSAHLQVRGTVEASKADFYAATGKEIDAFMDFPGSTRSVVIPGILQAVDLLTGELNRIREQQVQAAVQTINRVRWGSAEEVSARVQAMRAGNPS